MAAPAHAATLIDLTNMPQQFVTPENLTFTATSASTKVNFQGYQLPGTLVLVNLFLGVSGNSVIAANNLVGTHFTYTPASCGAFASEGSLGTYGTNDLTFGGSCVGSYDTFSQTLATIAGSSYNLRFSFSNVGQGPNALRVTTNDPSNPAVPEPSTWAMMLIGFGAVGGAMRSAKRRQKLTMTYA